MQEMDQRGEVTGKILHHPKKCKKCCKNKQDFWGNSYETCEKLKKVKEAFCELATKFQKWE